MIREFKSVNQDDFHHATGLSHIDEKRIFENKGLNICHGNEIHVYLFITLFIMMRLSLIPLTALFLAGTLNSSAQNQVTEIHTDFGGYWTSSTSAVNPSLPNELNQLLAFSVSGTTYSTGVNDSELDTQGVTYTAAEWSALEIPALSVSEPPPYAIIIGAAIDGNATGAGSFTAPANGDSVAAYLMDGALGLALGTGVANIPAANIDVTTGAPATDAVGDGVPDLLFVQTASPTDNDSIVLLDVNDNEVGTRTAIDWSTISVTGQWDADFYGVNGTLLGANQTLDIRMAAFDLSDLGITTSNVGSAAKVRYIISGTSDPAFLAFNNASFPGCDNFTFTGVSAASPASGAAIADGAIDAVISGGTEPFALIFTLAGDTIYSSGWNAIASGKHWVKAIDSNDCVSSNSLQVFLPHMKCQ